MEPERKIEKMLRSYARKRRATEGEPLKLHPAARRRLQDEVSRRAPEPQGEEPMSLWRLFRLQWALLAGFAVMIFLGTTLLMPTLRSAKREAESISTMNNLRQIGTAAQIVAGENNGKLPASLDALTNEFLPARALTDPATGKPFVYAAAGENLDDLQSNNVLAYSPVSKDGSAVLFADGRVEYANRKRFAELTNQRAAHRISYATTAATITPPPQESPAATRTFGTVASQSFIQSNKASNQQNFYRNEADSAQNAPVLQSFQMQQNGNSLSVVDHDGSVYHGSVQIAAAKEQEESAAAGIPAQAAPRLQEPAQQIQPAGAPQQTAQNYSFRVTGINRTLNENVIFSGSMTMPAGQQTYGGIGGGAGQQAQNAPQTGTNQQQWSLSNSRIVGTATIGRTNRIMVNAVPAP